jgi:hypothetical protein
VCPWPHQQQQLQLQQQQQQRLLLVCLITAPAEWQRFFQGPLLQRSLHHQLKLNL